MNEGEGNMMLRVKRIGPESGHGFGEPGDHALVGREAALRSLFETAAEIASLGVFVAMVGVWAIAIGMGG